MTARALRHRAAVRQVAAMLRRLGATVAILEPRTPAALLVDGHRVGVRVATAAVREHPVTVKGRRYVYQYPQLKWSLHTHNRKCRGVAAWVLVGRVGRERRVYVVPARAVRAKTIGLHLGTRSAARLQAYRDEWGVLIAMRRRRAA